MQSDIVSYFESCDPCQRLKEFTKYYTKVSRPLTNLFEVFLIDFAGLFITSSRKSNYLFIYLDHLTNWTLEKSTNNTTAETIIKFVEEDLVHLFGTPKSIIIDNTYCFLSVSMKNFEEEQGKTWKLVIAYVLIIGAYKSTVDMMSNGKEDRMVGTL